MPAAVQVRTPKGFKEAYEKYTEGGWQGLHYPEEYGGQGLPSSLGTVTGEMAATANWTWLMYPGLSKGDSLNLPHRYSAIMSTGVCCPKLLLFLPSSPLLTQGLFPASVPLMQL